MNSKRMFWLLSALCLLFVVGTVAGAYQMNSLFEKQSTKLSNAKAKLDALNQEKLDLAQAKKDISTYKDLYTISRTVVPENKDQAEAVRQIINLANQSGVTIDSITFPPSTLGGSTIGAGASASSTVSKGPSAAGGNPALSQLKAVPKIPGVYQLELVVASSTDDTKLASYPELIHFLAALEQNRLTALVSNIIIVPTSNSKVSTTSSFSFTLTLDIYIKPQGK